MTGPVETLLVQSEVARRLLVVAIRMFFRQDDPLGTHTVSHSALQLVIDNLNKRDSQELLSLGLSRGLFEAAAAYANGLSHPLLEQSAIAAHIQRLPADVFSQVRTGSYEDAGVHFEISSHLPKKFWRDYRRSWNQLKHAERDELIAIGPGTHNNAEVIAFALAGFVELGFAMTDIELRIFHLYRCCDFPDHPSFTAEQREKVDLLRRRGTDERKEICYFLVTGHKWLPDM